MKETKNIEKTLNAFTRYMSEKGYSAQGIQSYRNTVRRFLESNPSAKNYNYRDVLKAIERKIYRPQSLKTRQTMVIRIKKYYDYLLDTNQREDHPCRGLFLKGMDDRSLLQSDLFTMAELEALLTMPVGFSKMQQKNQAVISLLIYQAMTAEEIARLKLNHVDLERGIIKISGGSLLSTRLLQLSPRQYSILYEYMNEGREKIVKTDTESFSIGYTGKPDTAENIRTLVEWFRALYPGRNISPKSIRDSVISHWLNELKIPLEQVQLMAGHRWICSTERYTQHSITEDRDILKMAHPLG